MCETIGRPINASLSPEKKMDFPITKGRFTFIILPRGTPHTSDTAAKYIVVLGRIICTECI